MQLSVFAKLARKWGASGGHALEHAGIGVSRNTSTLPRRREVKREFSRAPLIQAPVWAGTTTVAAQRIIRHSNGQLLICVGGGITGSTEPTFNAVQPMTDGTVTWWALGRASRVNGDGYPVPTITVSTSISGLTARPLWANQSMFTALTCPNFVNGAAGNSLQQWCFNDGGSTSQQGIAVGVRGYLAVLEFMSDAPKVGIGSWNSAGSQIKVWVSDPDGSNCYPLEEDPTPYASGNPCYYIIDWTSKGGRKMRRYRVESAGVQNLTGIAVDAQSQVVPVRVTGPKAVWIGDSYGGTVSTYTCPVFEYLSERVMKGVGVRYTRNMHIGGAGYNNTGSGSGSPFYTALTVAQNNPNTGWNPDVVVCAHAFNDIGITSDAAIAATALQTWQTLRTQYPNAVIVIVGPWAGTTGPSVAFKATDTTLQTQFAAWSDPNSGYVSIVNDTGGSWITGTGNTAALTGSGSADFYMGADTKHPCFTGRQMYEDRLISAINALLESLGQ